MIVTFRFRRDSAANWSNANPVLELGEPGLETDTRRIKYGDGQTAWNSLAYAVAGAVAWADITGKPAFGALALRDKVNGNDWSGADLGIADGGTGASTAVAARTNLGIGTAGTRDTGTSGATVPLLSGANTFSALQTFTVPGTGTTPQVASFLAPNAATGGSGSGAYFNFGVASTTGNSGVLQFTYAGSNNVANFIAFGIFGYASSVNVFRRGLGVGTGATVPPTDGLAVAGPTNLGGRLNLATVPTYATDAAAGSGGLLVGDVYKTSTGELRIKLQA